MVDGVVYRALVDEMLPVVDAVVFIHCATTGLVEGRAVLDHDGAGDGAGVADVDVLAVGGEGDAVGLGEGVFDDGGFAGGGVEAVGGGF